MASVKVAYLVSHEYYREIDETDEFKIIGIYSSVELANEAVSRLRSAPGFVNHPEGFFVDEYEFDVDNWTEGFQTDFGPAPSE